MYMSVKHSFQSEREEWESGENYRENREEETFLQTDGLKKAMSEKCWRFSHCNAGVDINLIKYLSACSYTFKN